MPPKKPPTPIQIPHGTNKTPSPPRERELRPLHKRQISNRITRIPDIHLRARLVIIRQYPQIDRNLIILRPANIHPNVIHGRKDIIHARLIRRQRGAAVILREPKPHDALGARVCPVPGAGRGGGGGDCGAGVVDDGEAVVPGYVEAGAVV